MVFGGVLEALEGYETHEAKASKDSNDDLSTEAVPSCEGDHPSHQPADQKGARERRANSRAGQG